MKDTTRKILFFLYLKKTDSNPSLDEPQLSWLLPHITASGQRSLIYLLVKKGWITRRPDESGVKYLITSSGAKVLERELPGLSPARESWDRQWVIFIFLKSSGADSEFRKLRSSLLQKKAFLVTRGVYVLPTPCAAEIEQLCAKDYAATVLTVHTDGTGAEQIENATGVYQELSDQYSAYSGISSNISSLLVILSAKKELTSSDKEKISAQANNLYQALQEECGVGWTTWAQQVVRHSLVQKVNQLLHIL